MKALFLVLNKTEKLDEVLKTFLDCGVRALQFSTAQAWVKCWQMKSPLCEFGVCPSRKQTLQLHHLCGHG